MTNIYPPKRILMGPGPSDVHPRVLQAMAMPTIGHLDPVFQRMMDQSKDYLRALFKTENSLTFPISAPGSAGMEACFVNLLEAGDTAIVVRHGVFGDRMRENVIRCGANVIVVDAVWGTAPDMALVEDALKANPHASVLAFVHAETSTGVEADAGALCGLAQKYNCLSIVDMVTSLGGIPVDVDGWGADAVYSGSQKCLSCPPGLSPVSFSEKALNRIRSRKTPVQSWFLDLSLVMNYWDGEGGRSYHHTAPVNAMYGLNEALAMHMEEGTDNVHARHRLMHTALVAGLEAMGLSMLVDASCRLPQLNVVTVPEGVDEGAVRAHLLAHYGLEIGAGLGPLAGKVWRIGLMGEAARASNITVCLSALGEALNLQQHSADTGAALSAAQAVLAG